MASGGGSASRAIPMDQIVQSLKDMQKQTFTKETEWLFEKHQMTQRIS